MSVTLNDVLIVLANVYAPNDDNVQFYLDAFAQLDKFDNDSLIIAGDFIFKPLDYEGSRQIHSNVNSSKILISLIDEFNLIDIWRNYHPNLR